MESSVISAIDAVSMGYQLGMMQNQYEIEEAAKFIKSLEIDNFMEIGTDQGGTFVVWSALAKSKNGIRISLDIPHGPWGRHFDLINRNSWLDRMGSNVSILEGDSHTEESLNKVKNIIGDSKLDFLFIDGDHSYIGVKLDYYMYRQFVKPGGWIGFHDIKKTDFHAQHGCHVDRLWDELTGEKIEFKSEDNWGGIGFIKVSE